MILLNPILELLHQVEQDKSILKHSSLFYSSRWDFDQEIISQIHSVIKCISQVKSKNTLVYIVSR